MENKNYGTLFNDINVMSEEHLQLIIDSLNVESSKQLLIKGITSAYQRGAFTMTEVEILSKSIRLLSKPAEQIQKNNE